MVFHNRRRGGAMVPWLVDVFSFSRPRVDSEQIELRFFWPRPPVVIPVSELAEVEFSPAYRSCGHIELSTQTERYLSVNFTDCKMFATLRDEFTAKAGAQWR